MMTRTVVLSEDPEFLAELSEYLEVLSSPTRLKILRAIERRPMEIREIASEIETSYENTKKHLNKLTATGIIKKEAGLGRETAKGVHPVWKFSLQPGGLESVITSLGVFSSGAVPAGFGDVASRVRTVKSILTGGEALPMLLLTLGEEDGRVFPLNSDTIALGREDLPNEARYTPATDIILPASYAAVSRVSRPHARLSRTGEQWRLEDCGSTGQTMVNGVPLGRGEKRPVIGGDIIDLANGVGSARFVVIGPDSDEG
ncbi:FHA domain-containing protein [Methanogenium sp. S4BF]|uniref:FHA domain-containing protein n=1 Tax=Methanogenium sp. S4BF TaxID=1789226 RepID=UPI0024171B8A|nr:FHA domain-containing protein [Methanogenium sp. S4BF]WFN34284.1 FHA domain-containing protein [Methanogenium sp. S4BF]